MMKECRECGQTLAAAYFHKKSDSADGLYPFCKDCRRAREGHVKQKPPRVRQQNPDASFEDLVADVIELSARYPSNVKYRNAANQLRKCPTDTDDYTTNLLYECWERRQKQHHDFTELDESAPIITMSKLKRIGQREFTNMLEYR